MMRRHVRAALIGWLAMVLLQAAAFGSEGSHSGTWRVVEARTWLSDGMAPDGRPARGLSLALILQFSGDRFVYCSINDTDRTQPPQEFQFATTLDGAVQPVPNRKAGDFDQISFEKVGTDQYRMLRWLKGDLVAVQFWTFSTDKPELVRRGTTKTPTGQWHAYEEWFARQ